MKQRLRDHLTTLLLLALAAALLAVGSRYIFSSTTTPDVSQDQPERMTQAAPTTSRRATSDEILQITAGVLRHMVSSRTAIIVDARLHTLFRDGHIPGALNLPALRPSDGVLQKILAYPRHVTVVVYCESENCTDSKTVAELLREKGMTDIRILEGGMELWLAHGFPVLADG